MFCKTSIVYLITTLLLLNFLTCAEFNVISKDQTIANKKHLSIYDANELALMRKDFWKKSSKIGLIQKSDKAKVTKNESLETKKFSMEIKEKSKKSKNSSVSVGKTRQKQKFIPNPFLDPLDEMAESHYTINEPCKHKNGFLYMLEKSKTYSTDLEFVKVLVLMDQDEINFQASTDSKSKFQTVPMKDIIKIGKKFKNSYCFEIIFHQNMTLEKALLHNVQRGEMTICGRNIPQMKDWIAGILIMKSCKTKTTTVADFQAINELIKKKPELLKGIAKQKKINASMSYPGDKKIWQDSKKINYVIDPRDEKSSKATETSYQSGSESSQVKKSSRRVFTEAASGSTAESSATASAKSLSATKARVETALHKIHNTIEISAERQELMKKKLKDRLNEIKNQRKSVKLQKEMLSNMYKARKIADSKSKADYRTMLIFKRQASILESANEEIKRIKVFIINNYY